MNRAGIVFVQNMRAGLITETDTGYEFYYEKPVETEDGEKIGIVLFKIQINKKWYKFDGFSMNEEQAWLAIHELEELSYKELEVFNDKSI